MAKFEDAQPSLGYGVTKSEDAGARLNIGTSYSTFNLVGSS